jgi:hypothetical protein
MRVILLVAAAAFSTGAWAAEPAPLEPALQFSWTFGATRTPAPPQLRLGVYPGDLAWRRMWADLGVRDSVQLPRRPELLGVELGRDPQWRLAGLSLDQAEASEPNWPLRIGVGAAVVVGVWALAVREFGEALAEGLGEGFAPGPDDGDAGDDDGDRGGILCVNGQCVLPCGGTGPINSCNDGQG